MFETLDTHNNSEIHFASKLEERVVFFFVTVGIVTLTYGFFTLIDFLPEDKINTQEETFLASEDIEESEETITPTEEKVAVAEFPISIIFDSLNNREVTVLNPESASVEALDAALLHGAVRHPDSADFERVGTIFLLGHSSYLPNVMNKNFQAFNGIQKLVWGDTVRLRSFDTEYTYSVDRIYEAKATDTDVPIEYGKSKLVLATCNSFGTKDDRFVVEAVLVSSKSL